MSDQSEKDLKEYYEQIEKLQGGGPMIGATMRDYFAAKFAAAQSVMTSADRDFIKPDYNYPEGMTVAERIAQTSYQLADAMLAERAK